MQWRVSLLIALHGCDAAAVTHHAQACGQYDGVGMERRRWDKVRHWRRSLAACIIPTLVRGTSKVVQKHYCIQLWGTWNPCLCTAIPTVEITLQTLCVTAAQTGATCSEAAARQNSVYSAR